ncbi:murein hydrolase activator EnvC family protein [Clostridium ganghwense]|uniref:M23 family metallopeptidase n=1 Tax=Clostridium ganghwense TaxID=312089 RepID=A0ABT4CS23_9CLOT|nr:M23 family metallopeptidase [Clostridium ganghwense]MCY6371869.1 M23 family metallopeptidase [Clostridium ganghwense]
MGNFNAEYESYYNSIVNKRNSSTGYYSGISEKKPQKNRIIKKIIQDLCGVLAMFIFVLICKVVVTPQTAAAYKYCKGVVNKNYDYKQIIYQVKHVDTSKNIQDKIVDFIDKIESNFTGGETIKNKIKEKFALPVRGNVIKSSQEGIDIKTMENSRITASYDGKVKECGKDENLGQYILIDHGDGLETRYSNLNNIMVKKEDKVKKGEIIGVSGKYNSQDTVHFEVLFMGQNKDLEKNVEMKK